MALTGTQAYALSKKYTNDTVIGAGALKGKNCVVTQIEDTEDGHIVHFQWTLDDGTVQTDTMEVLDGEGANALTSEQLDSLLEILNS